MNRKYIWKAVIAFIVALALILSNSAIANFEKNINDNTISNKNTQILNKPVISINDNIKEKTSDSINWPMFHHDLANTGFSTSVAPNTNNLIWTYAVSQGIRTSPAIVNGKVYFGSTNKNIYCLNTSDGSFIWKYTTNGEIWSSPAVADGKVYFSSDDNKFYCLNASDGAFIWSHIFGDPSYHQYSSPTVAYGRVYIGSCIGYSYGNLYCFNASDGSLIWNYATGAIRSAPAIVDGKVFVSSIGGSRDDIGNIYCINATDGSFIWRYITEYGGDMRSSPAVAYGRVYFGCGDHNLYCLDATDGSLIWKYLTEHAVISSPAVAHGKVFFGSRDGKLYCLNATDGSLIWWHRCSPSTLLDSSPAVADGMVYLGTHNGKFYCFDESDGTVIWINNDHYNGLITHSPAIADGKVFVGRSRGIFYCFERSNHNVGIISIDSPIDGPASIFIPEITMRNLAHVSETDVPVNMVIEKIEFPNTIIEYNKTIHVDIDSEEIKSVIFPDWTPKDIYDILSGSISYRITVCTQLINDGEPDNDELVETITLDYIHDIGIREITEPSAPLRNDNWIHFDDGVNYGSVGGIGGIFEAAIRITPDELGSYDGWILTAVKFYHRDPYTHSGIIKIYEAGTSTTPGPLITSEPYTVTGRNWFEISLSDPVMLDADEDIWASVEITYLQGEYPMGIDNGIAIPGKGDWYYSESLGWIELRNMNINNNWNLWAKVEEIEPWSIGTYPVECIVKNYGSFNESDFNVNATIYNETEETFYHDDFLVITTMHLQDEITVAFDNVTFEGGDAGSYRLEVFTELDGDDNPLNDLAILNFIIGNDTTPPVTTCELDGIMEGDVYITDVTVTLTATDDLSGVNYTIYKINDGEWQLYETPFVVSEDGNHTVYFYSIDNAENIEDTKSETFTIQKPCPIEIEVSGGIGVNAVITNTGDMDITNLEWNITITGGLFGLVNKETSGTISSLAIGGEKTVSSGIFLGLGSINITVTADDIEETRDGIQLIIFTKIMEIEK